MLQANFRYSTSVCTTYSRSASVTEGSFVGTRSKSTSGLLLTVHVPAQLQVQRFLLSTTTGAVYLMLGHATIILQIMTFYLAHGVAHFRYRSSAACIEYALTYL